MGLCQRDAFPNQSSQYASVYRVFAVSLQSSFFSRHGRVLWLLTVLMSLLSGLSGCSSLNHYRDVEKSLLAGNPEQADQLVRKAKKDYGQRNRLLYLMDRGMTLHLAGRYQESNLLLEDADTLIEDYYTTRIRDEVSAILLSETRLPYQGDPYEQVMVNVLKALNYAILQDVPAALVEARRIDHRLNLIGDSVDKDEYHEDPFARYLTGLLYESSGDANNAFIAYQKAEEGYRLAESWSHVVIPSQLKEDLLRTSKALGLTEEFQSYQQTYPDALEPLRGQESMAQVVVISLNGRGPTKKDVFLDVPISLDALQLIALTKNGFGRSSRRTRGAESVLYGLQGDIVRVALPRVLPQLSSVSYSTIQIDNGRESFQKNTQRMYDVNAVAKKNLDDGYTALAIRAVARAAMKMAAAVSIGYGARSAVNKKSQAVVGLAASSIAKIFAIATEEADIRAWRTLPGEFHLARVWVPAGTYSLTVDSYDPRGQAVPGQLTQQVTLKSGKTHFVTQRILQ